MCAHNLAYVHRVTRHVTLSQLHGTRVAYHWLSYPPDEARLASRRIARPPYVPFATPTPIPPHL